MSLSTPQTSPAPGRELGHEAGPLWMRAVAWLVARLPYRWLSPLGALLGLFAGSLLRIRRRHVEASLRAAGIERASAVARGMYVSLGRGLFELLWMAGGHGDALGARVTLSPACIDALTRAMARGRGVLIATAHTGNWDLTACAAARFLRSSSAGSAGFGPRRLYVVTKRLSFRALDRYWQRLRAEQGVVLVDARGAITRVREALKENALIALLVDQVPERGSGVVTLPFFGRPARHDLAPALLAARAKVPILFVAGHRKADGSHRVELELVIEPQELAGGRRAVIAATLRITEALERFVRAHPEQWLWLHRRWKGYKVDGGECHASSKRAAESALLDAPCLKPRQRAGGGGGLPKSIS